jgi:uncharacterized protein YdiU (UPF0061 family)
MAALGVPTTRSLAAVTTGEQVVRETPQPGGILTRVAGSHIRIGTFQYFAARQDWEALRALADHVIGRHYPEAADSDRPYLALLQAAIARQAWLIAQWQQLGFIHGVMNTDNMLLCGETIDYGPCAFMDSYHPDTVYSSIDSQGRYAYRNQPAIAQWNLAWLAQSLLPLLDDDETVALQAAQQAIGDFAAQYQQAYDDIMQRKLGLTRPDTETKALVDELLTLMADAGADYTLTFRRLAERAGPADGAGIAGIFELPERFDAWIDRWQARLAAEDSAPAERQRMMFAVNPAFIPRNHLVEEAIRAAADNDDFAPFHQLVDLLAMPYRYQPSFVRHAMPPRPEQVVRRTFCGT